MSGASLTTPVIMSGATSPAPRAIARIRPVRMPGAAAGSTTRQNRLELGGACRERGFTHRARHGRQRFFGRHNHDRHRQHAERQRRPEDAARAERRRGQALRKEHLIDRPADQIHEEAEAEHAEHDRRHAGKVVDRDPDEPHEHALLRVFAEVQRGQHAERHGDHAHEHHHHDRAENGRENAAFGVRLARIAAQELP